ncbi:LIC_11883 family protein [Leptospira alstonii]|uniref:Uncharacterized protein n=2 Tax=Leptospira alstonii TaxID=28452 RepID=M6D011_9LEPT|nr:hypothetical protein [Leptospira alstonii]EMJ96046.1 hypothetical protein LEP1GSC194_0409 [Leptospira alstonii serovar Sichuan str. 79601]EQA79937.1 hypothetical protein LEP1GSC193_2188 [Leptospira alstonii serovar Pingchang str. 80-412]
MRRSKSIISIKRKIKLGVLLRTVAFCIVFSFLNVSVFAQNSDWKEYSLRELIGRLKYYTYAKVAQSLRKEYTIDREQIWEDGVCKVPVPPLPGPFFCGLLKQQYPSESQKSTPSPETISSSPISERLPESVSETLSPHSAYGLNPGLKVYKNIQLYSGTTISGKNVVKIDSEENPGESLRAFYLNNGQLSHYEFQDRILIFDWSGSKLNAILEVKTDPIRRPLSGREILFP